MPRKYKFSFHYHKLNRGASCHFRGKCLQAKDIKILQVFQLESKHHNRQPYWTVDGYAEDVRVEGDFIVVRNNVRLK